MIIRTFTHWWRQVVFLDKNQRLLLYEALSAQIEAGIPPQQAFEALHTISIITPAISRVAGAAATAGREGRLLSEGLADSQCIPALELGVLKVAERNNRLAAACANIQARNQDKLSFAVSVIAPNAYYEVIVAALLFMAWQAQDILAATAKQVDLATIPAYQLSSFLHHWMIIITIAVVVAFVAVVVGRSQWVGWRRALLWFFDREYRAILAVRVADMAAALSTEGANHIDILDAIAEAFGDEGYVLWAVSVARERHAGAGETIEDALSGTLLPPSLATLLSALTPGGKQQSYPLAYRTLSRVQRAQLQAQYAVLANGLRLLLLTSAALLIILLLHGIYTAVLSA